MTAEALGEALDWSESGWPDFTMYHPIFTAAPEAAIYGALVPRDAARAVFDTGPAEAFGPEAARYGLDRDLDPAEQTTREAMQMAAHCDALPEEMLPGMVAVQRLRDAVLARAVIRAMDETGGPVAVITGNGHARRDWGVPAVLAEVAPDLDVWVLGQTEDGPPAGGRVRHGQIRPRRRAPRPLRRVSVAARALARAPPAPYCQRGPGRNAHAHLETHSSDHRRRHRGVQIARPHPAAARARRGGDAGADAGRHRVRHAACRSRRWPGASVFSDLFDLTDEAEMGHIELSRSADLIVVAPATADLMAKMAQGHADDLASTLLLATDTPVLLAPAMNVRMWQHAATQRNIETLIGDGIGFVGPNEGDMACGEHGPGRMAEVPEIWRPSRRRW